MSETKIDSTVCKIIKLINERDFNLHIYYLIIQKIFSLIVSSINFVMNIGNCWLQGKCFQNTNSEKVTSSLTLSQLADETFQTEILRYLFSLSKTHTYLKY
jgi:hypothetical protein